MSNHRQCWILRFIRSSFSRFTLLSNGKLTENLSFWCNLLTHLVKKASEGTECFSCDACFVTGLKNKIQNDSTWEVAFYQSKWFKINSNELFSFFLFECVAANTFNFFFFIVWPIFQIFNALYTILTFHFEY